MRVLMVACAIFVLGACSMMSKEQCESVNWKAVGYRDGKNGSKFDEFQEKKRNCGEHGIAANEADYLVGYKEGIKLYCTEDNGRMIGERGGYYAKVCPADLEPAFLRGYDAGVKAYEVAKQKRELEAKEDELKRKEEELKRKEHDLERQQQEIERKKRMGS